MSGKVGGKAVKGARGKKVGGSKTRSAKAGLTFPVGRIGRHMKKGRFAKRIGGDPMGRFRAFVSDTLCAILS